MNNLHDEEASEARLRGCQCVECVQKRKDKEILKLSTLICDKCNQSFEYEDDGETFACMPDGEVVGSCWYCSNCCGDDEK